MPLTIKELKIIQNRLLTAMIKNGMPTRDDIVNREKNACLQFVRHIYYRMASEVLQKNIPRIDTVTRSDLQLILDMEIDNPDYETMESFLEKLYDTNWRKIFECNVLYEEKSFWSLCDVVGTFKNYMNSNSVLKKSTGGTDYIISIYDCINK
ncbi:MAG: hypothetical protein IK025_05525 [Bacteroidales bacterium]|nr:hypothetical protein [Bacteroidales bacterium]